MSRLLAGILAVALVLTGAAPVVAEPSGQPMLDVIVVLKSHADVSGVHTANRAARLSAVVRKLRAHAMIAQRGVLGMLSTRARQGRAEHIDPLWIDNAVAVRATPSVVRELATRSDVREVRPNVAIQAPAAVSGVTSVEPNLAVINAPAMWDNGFRGQGVVVANLDTGVDASHPDLAGNWRGGTNSWYDPNGQHPSTPTDVNGHGTQTMGVLAGSSTGVAPAAKWIAAKIFNDRGTATTTGIHLAFQWLLDPDHNPDTADAPDVVNASWTMATPGCVLDFQPDLRNLRAAGILPVFAAGNYGPSAGTVYSPANLPEAFSVGDTDNADALEPYSSRGPSACAGASSPSLVAPGVDIRTTDLYGGYVSDTGTSVAAPHVAGSLALLLSAFPGLSATEQQDALASGAVPLGAAEDFGHGRLDALGAYQWLATAPRFTLSASPSSATTAPGGTVGYDVTVTGVNGFASDVSLALTGTSGWTFDPPVLPGGSGVSRLTVTTSSSIAPGPHPLTITATGGGLTRSSTVDLTVQAPPDFTLGATPSTKNTPAGGSAAYTVSIGSQAGFTGDVSLSLGGLPAPVGTATFAPPSVNTAGTGQLTITTQPTAAPGSYPLTITGTSGSLTHTTSITLVVSNFTVSASPASQSTAPGGTATYTVTVGAVSGFTGAVGLSSSGLSTSVGNATFSPGTVNGSGTSQLAITTQPGAPPGSYPLTVTGTSGALTHTASLTLVVSNPDFVLGATPSSITIVRGQTASYTVSVAAQGGFTGSVTLSAAGSPSGSSTTFSVNPVATPGSSTLRIKTTSLTARGTFTIRVTGTSGTRTHQITVTLVVR